jgi:GntR family transcriptional regulator
VNSLNILLDFGSNEPIYAQIVDQVQMQLTTGELRPGEQLPTVRQLASELRVNFNTIARAYRLLDEAGMISTQRGRGTYLLEYDETKGTMVRKESMEDQLERTIHSLVKQGYGKNEIRTTFSKILDSTSEEK